MSVLADARRDGRRERRLPLPGACPDLSLLVHHGRGGDAGPPCRTVTGATHVGNLFETLTLSQKLLLVENLQTHLERLNFLSVDGGNDNNIVLSLSSGLPSSSSSSKGQKGQFLAFHDRDRVSLTGFPADVLRVFAGAVSE